MLMHLRVFVEVSQDEEAQRIASELVHTLDEVARLKSLTTKPYWKIPEYYELYFIFDLADAATPEVWEQVISKLGTGWQHVRESELDAMWNDGEGGEFAAREARWAHVEFIPTGEEGPVGPVRG